jgi:hypothetical protein
MPAPRHDPGGPDLSISSRPVRLCGRQKRDAEESLMPLPPPTAPASKSRLRAGCILGGLAVHADEKVYT